MKYFAPVLLLFSFLELSFAQELPTLTLTQFDTNVTFRTDVCSRHDLYQNGDVEFRDALEGLNLSAVFRANKYFQLDGDNVDASYPGLTGVLMDELARRAKFTWRNSFATVGTPIDGRSFTELLDWTTETYDISVNWWTWSSSRRSLGINFPESWYDASIIMVSKVDNEDEAKFSAFSWLTPFDRDVWLMILTTIIFSGMVYFFLTKIDF